MAEDPKIRLTVDTAQSFDVISIHVGGNGLADPADLQAIAMPPLRPNAGVVISGKVPAWLHAHVLFLAGPAPWCAIYDPSLHNSVLVAQSGHDVLTAVFPGDLS